MDHTDKGAPIKRYLSLRVNDSQINGCEWTGEGEGAYLFACKTAPMLVKETVRERTMSLVLKKCNGGEWMKKGRDLVVGLIIGFRTRAGAGGRRC